MVKLTGVGGGAGGKSAPYYHGGGAACWAKGHPIYNFLGGESVNITIGIGGVTATNGTAGTTTSFVVAGKPALSLSIPGGTPLNVKTAFPAAGMAQSSGDGSISDVIPTLGQGAGGGNSAGANGFSFFDIAGGNYNADC
ncbi:MAG: hypothetical protein GY862_15165, partial [Gammaproteobacteria bacterium]|nr:hypothetical protein [Gammaproteobacteria bacterium]